MATLKITALSYGLEDGYPFMRLEVNGRTVELDPDSLNSIAKGWVLLEGVGLPETTVVLSDCELEGQLTDDPFLLRLCRQFLDDVNAKAHPFETILGRRPLPRA